MKLEIICILIVCFFVYDTYYGGFYTKYITLFKKYYKLAGILFLIFSIYITLKKNPSHIKDLFLQSNTIMQGLPLKTFNITNLTKDIISENKMEQSGKTTTKRSVSETKKKFIAYKQEWKCGKCNKVLNAWFEVDHKISLENGGSNHVDNLIAMCRECHGEKTAMENM